VCEPLAACATSALSLCKATLSRSDKNNTTLSFCHPPPRFLSLARSFSLSFSLPFSLSLSLSPSFSLARSVDTMNTVVLVKVQGIWLRIQGLYYGHKIRGLGDSFFGA